MFVVYGRASQPSLGYAMTLSTTTTPTLVGKNIKRNSDTIHDIHVFSRLPPPPLLILTYTRHLNYHHHHYYHQHHEKRRKKYNPASPPTTITTTIRKSNTNSQHNQPPHLTSPPQNRPQPSPTYHYLPTADNTILKNASNISFISQIHNATQYFIHCLQ